MGQKQLHHLKKALGFTDFRPLYVGQKRELRDNPKKALKDFRPLYVGQKPRWLSCTRYGYLLISVPYMWVKNQHR